MDWTPERQEWARDRLVRFKAACEAYGADRRARRHEGYDGGLYTEMTRQQHKVQVFKAAIVPRSVRHVQYTYFASPGQAVATVSAVATLLAALIALAALILNRG